MKKNKKVENIGIGRVCPKCNGNCVIRKRIAPPINKNFYYKQWDFCKKCNAVYFEEKYKSSEWVENERQQDFFSNLRNESI